MLILNPGGTSTKMAIYEGEKQIVSENVEHPFKEMKNFKTIWEQWDIRMGDVFAWVEKHGWRMEDFDVFIGRCGTGKPSAAGVYEIGEEMVDDFRNERYGSHPSFVGCCMVYELANQYGKPALTADPAHSNEMMYIATFSGHPAIERIASFHVLNHKAISRRLAADLGKAYDDINIIIAHVGGGITVGAHQHGKVIDVNCGLEGDGPFSPVRTGALPVGGLIKLCYSGKYTEQEMHNQCNVSGGVSAYLGTSNGKDIEARIQNGDQYAKNVIDAMIFQISKEIGARAVVLRGHVDAIALTGGLAKWERVVSGIRKWVQHIAPIYVYPGEDELEALTESVLRYLRGEVELMQY